MQIEDFDRQTDTAKRVADNMLADLAVGRVPGYTSSSYALAIYNRIFDVAEKCAPIKKWGNVLEIGAGSGIGGALLSRRDTALAITITDFWPELTDSVIPKCVETFGCQGVPVVSKSCDFNNMEFADATFDTVLAKGTLHHSRSLDVTVREIFRVLKPGGICLAVERAHEDDSPDEALERLLAEEAPDVYKQKLGVPTTLRITRRDLGEHELRMGEWRSVFERTGFEVGMLSSGHWRTRQRRAMNPVFWLFAPAIAALKIARVTLRLPVDSISSTVTRAYHALAIPEVNIEYLMSWRRRLKNRAAAEHLGHETGGIKDTTLSVDSSWLFGQNSNAPYNLIILARKPVS